MIVLIGVENLISTRTRTIQNELKEHAAFMLKLLQD